MRSLKPVVLCACLVVLMTACPEEPPPICGDGTCEAASGENRYSCSSDCGGDPIPSGYCDSPASATGAELDIRPTQQWCDQWCWSAVITTVANYYGLSADGFGPVNECQLASGHAGDWTLSLCCQYTACAYQACNSPSTFQQMSRIMTALGLTEKLVGRPLNEAEIQIELANGRPIIMAIQSQTSGHVAILSGYANGAGPTIYRVDDPWPYDMWGVPSLLGAGTRYFMSYRQLLHGSTTGQSFWTATYTGIAARTDGCSSAVNPSCGCADASGP